MDIAEISKQLSSSQGYGSPVQVRQSFIQLALLRNEAILRKVIK